MYIPVAIDCGTLLAPSNGAVVLNEGSLVGATANYTCDPSFRLIGGVGFRICQENGLWSGEAPICKGNGFISRFCSFVQNFSEYMYVILL